MKTEPLKTSLPFRFIGDRLDCMTGKQFLSNVNYWNSGVTVWLQMSVYPFLIPCRKSFTNYKSKITLRHPKGVMGGGVGTQKCYGQSLQIYTKLYFYKKS